MKRNSLTILALVATLFVFRGCTTNEVPADTVLIHGNIITVARGGDRAEALAIKDGKIIAIGMDAEIQKNIDDGPK